MKHYEVGPDDKDPKDQAPVGGRVMNRTSPEDSDPPPPATPKN